MNYDEPEQPPQPIKKIDDEVLDRFINTYGFKQEVRDTKKGEQKLNIASASIGDNIYIIRKIKNNKNGNNNYSFLSVSKNNFENFRGRQIKDFTSFKFIDFDTKYFKKNEQKFIKSLKENKMFDDKKVKDGNYKEFENRTIQTLTIHPSERIQEIDPKEIEDIQPLPVREKKELMGDDEALTKSKPQGSFGDDDEEEEEEERMIDEDDEEEEALAKSKSQGSSKDKYKEPVLSANDFEKVIKEEHRKKRKDDFEDNQVFLADEYDKEKEYSDDERELFKQAKKIKDRKLNKQLEEYNKKFHPEQEIQQKKQRSGVMNEEDRDVFKQLTEDLGFKKLKGNTAKTYLRIGDDVIFIKKVPEGKKYSNIFGDDPYLAVKLNKEDFKKLFNNQKDDIEAEYFNFNTNYFNKNKDKFREAIKKGEFIFDDKIKETKERAIKRLKKADEYSDIGDKFTFDQIQDFNILPGKRQFDYVKMFDLKRGNISEERGDDGQQLIKFSKDGKNVTVNLPNKYLSNGYPDSLLKLIVGVSENNKGEVDFKEIGEIQDLNGDITNLYSDMQDLKSKINSSKNAEEKERLLIKYNKKRLKLEDLIKKYSKEAYRLSMLNKKKKATYSNPNYIKNKLNKL